VCSSTFASNEWRENLLAGLVPDLSIYNTTDYRRFLLAHLHFLNGLCQISIQTVNNSVSQFLSSTLSNTQLISEVLFNLQINSLIEQSQLDAPTAFNRILFLLRTINHGNAIVSTYGTNFEYTALLGPYINFALVQAVTYDNNCSCGLNATCTTQANFISNNASEIIPVKGLKMGCTPSESLLASTLECFYDSSCIKLIQEQTNYNSSINTTIPLSQNSSHFLINTTVRDLVNVLFVEDWSTQINYSSYFEQCSPSMCSYTYIQQFNLIYTITFLISIYGGLTIALKWICPWIVRLVAKMNQYRKKKSNTVQPTNTIDTISSHTNVQHTTVNSVLVSTNTTTETRRLSSLLRNYNCVFWFIILMIMVVIAIIVSTVYLIRQGNNQVVSTGSSMNETNFSHMIVTTTSGKSTTSSVTTLPTSTVSTCQLMFNEPISLNITSSSVYDFYKFYDFATAIVNDFNGDGLLDFVATYVSLFGDTNLYVFLGKGDGTFTEKITSPTGINNGDVPAILAAADFNNDGHQDLAGMNYYSGSVGILFGVSNGTFETMQLLTSNSQYLYVFYFKHPWLTTSDLNGDSYIDIVFIDVTSCSIGLFFGYGNGTFTTQITLPVIDDFCLSSAAVADFDGDGKQDIAVTLNHEFYVSVMLGYNIGSFKEPIILSTGDSSYPTSTIANDFNGDRYLDIVVANTGDYNIGVFLGNGDGSFRAQMIFKIKTLYPPYSITAVDFNGDGQLDITIAIFPDAVRYGLYPAVNFVYVMLEYDNGSFGESIQVSTWTSNPAYIGIGDFNGDGGFDLILLGQSQGNNTILLNTSPCSIRNSSSQLYSSTTKFP
ncbi:unnamed protein product, partial [Adineta steineri]